MARPRRERTRRLRRECRSLLRDLDVQAPIDIDELCDGIGHRRGRPINLVPKAIGPDGPFGAWLKTPSADLVFYEQDTSLLHQTHIVLHELGHILADHDATNSPRETMQTLLPDLDPTLIQQILGRTHLGYDSTAEFEAETIATTILVDADIMRTHSVQLSPADHETVHGRLKQALYERRGWQ